MEALYLSKKALWISSSLSLVTVRQQTCGKVMFLHLSVILSTGSGLCPEGSQVQDGDSTPRPILKRTVRILLECILVTTRLAKRAKVMFLQACVTHSVQRRGGGAGGGEGGHQHQWSSTSPPDQVRMSTPSPPRTRSEHIPPPPRDQVRMSTPSPPGLGQNIYPLPPSGPGQNVYSLPPWTRSECLLPLPPVPGTRSEHLPPPPSLWTRSECLPPPPLDQVRMSTPSPPPPGLGQNIYPPLWTRSECLPPAPLWTRSECLPPPPPQTTRRRAVRILLECILV